jgi:hypothetical protein
MKITTLITSDIKKLKDAAKLFKKDETRPYLNNFLIVKRGDVAEALATCGHVAITIQLNATLENVERFQLSFAALKSVSDKENLEILQDEKDKLTLKSGAMLLNVQNVGEVPEITRVMNPFLREESDFSFTVNPKLFAHFTNRGELVTVKIKGTIAQIFDHKTEEKMGVLMLARNE